MFSDLPFSDIIIVILSIFFSMAVHEAMHAFAAHALGDTTARDQGRLTLNPLRHVDLSTTLALPIFLILIHQPPIFAAKPVPFDPSRVRHGNYGAALVALAGPFTNLGLAIVSAIIMRLFTVAIGTETFNVLYLFMQVNVGFFVFNMIPFPPLDGSRLLYAFAPEPIQEIMYRIESAGFLAILAFIFIAFRFISPVIGNVETSILNLLL